ncbi:uncharacterized protein PHACADRAFT_31550 [Phanerochaete carnosa HHB-10118-sp]|uniref:F-box domain-containing protein n=1 Tax=Phanerochaete carnosa (strain HHB-10118-sp) TaxID=650164 RepID=K5WN28_PHACS|nr:uncharacterized protein PHACADRAFT_31550 [Phanerochaete carnosa HHB-10118-sp]EKM51732.1 hypothetical protein PHACADRAFT_31550 [Phanerochaete carnosa HHB-10118-sp]
MFSLSVWCRIFCHCRTDLSTLRACSTLSKTIHPLPMQLLYHDLTIDLDEEPDTILEERLRNRRHTLRFHRIITWIDHDDDSTVLTIPDILVLLSHTPRCTSLQFISCCIMDNDLRPHDLPVTLMAHLTELHIADVTWSDPTLELARLAHLCPTLKRITVFCITWGSGLSARGAKILPSNVEEIQIAPLDEEQVWRIIPLLKGCRSSLIRLHISVAGSGYRKPLLICFCMMLSRQLLTDPNAAHWVQELAVLKTCSRLETFSWAVRLDDSTPDAVCARSDTWELLLLCIPRCIKKIFAYIDYRTSSILQVGHDSGFTTNIHWSWIDTLVTQYSHLQTFHVYLALPDSGPLHDQLVAFRELITHALPLTTSAGESRSPFT